MISSINKVRVLVVDDSSVTRTILSKLLSEDPKIDVIGTAPDANIAKKKILLLKPDVITLDINMPKVNGLAFLEQIMKEHPLPVIIVSSTTKQGSSNALKALELGAFDFISKPGIGSLDADEMKRQLIEKVKASTKVRLQMPTPKKELIKKTLNKTYKTKMIAIGASTGGPEAVKEIIYRLPDNLPGIVVAIHMPKLFTKSFAEHVNERCNLNVKEAENGDVIVDGSVLIAPGGYHTIVNRRRDKYFVEIHGGAKVKHQKPSVDVLFQSVASKVGDKAIGVILTGMGDDGASGMLEMKKANSYNIAQDQKSCVVFGMPKEAINNGSVDSIVSLENIAYKIVNSLR